MGLLGDLLSTTVNIVNIPAKVIDEVIFDDNTDRGESTISAPLDVLSKVVKKVDE